MHQPRLRLLALLATLTVAVAACTTPPQPDRPVTPTNPTGVAAGASTPAVPAGTGTGSTASPGSAGATEVVSSPSADPAPTIRTTPAADATGVSPIAPVTVQVTGGVLDNVVVTNPDGKEVAGQLAADNTSWTSAEPLGYNRTYTVTAAAAAATGVATTATSSFTTLQPAGLIFPSFEPPPSRTTVGVGHPIVVIFDNAPPDKAAAEKAVTVDAVPATEGSWSWVDDRTMHWRPKDFCQAGTQVTVTAKIYGVDLGGGMYGETDRTLNLTIGPAKIATIDNATKTMTVTVDGQVVQTIPVSMGRDDTVTVDGQEISFVTPSGIYVAQEKYEVKQMSSASYGLPTSYELGYDQAIPLAVRISNSGIFVHSAPWSVADQGVRNVSHGCININPEAAQWFYDNFSYGDVVQITGTTTQLAPDDGYGDWNIPWEQWQQCSALN